MSSRKRKPAPKPAEIVFHPSDFNGVYRLKTILRSFPPTSNSFLIKGKLALLRELLLKRREIGRILDPFQLKLLDRSIFSTYCALLSLNQRESAREILKEIRLEILPVAKQP